MKRFQKIMVVLGQESLGPRHAVLERAMRLARENRASLRLVTIVEEFPVFLLRPAQEGHRFGRILATVDPAPIPGATELVGALDDQQGQVRRDLNRKIIELASSLAGQEWGEYSQSDHRQHGRGGVAPG